MSQVFKNYFSKDILFEFLDTFCDKVEHKDLSGCYEFNNTSYKKAKYEETALNVFYKKLKPYYHNSKMFYVDREKTHKNVITVLRQICKFLKITYTSKIKYRNSGYSIIYFISAENTPENC
jgi:hypothetical protein